MTPSGGGSKNLLKIQLQYQGMNVYNILTMYEVYSLAYISKWRGKQIVSRRNDQMIYIMSLQKKINNEHKCVSALRHNHVEKTGKFFPPFHIQATTISDLRGLLKAVLAI
jgi:hypothetical protein